MALDTVTLLKEIHDRFTPMPYPGDDQIVYDNTGNHAECERIKHLLKGHHWRDIPFELLDELHSALFFMTPAGYRFYLPAFMFYSVTDFDSADVIPDEVIQTLTLPNISDIHQVEKLALPHPEMQPFDPAEWNQILATIANTYSNPQFERTFFDRVSGFNSGQSKAILQFLMYMQEVYGDEFPNHQPEQAIERYWYQYRDSDV